MKEKIRTFSTGADRDAADNKPSYAQYLSPIVIKRFGEYMLKHQTRSDGTKRPGDNWKMGIPKEEYLESGFRHFTDWWLFDQGYKGRETLDEALCALMFNVMGRLHEELKDSNPS
jgi:hypothetical protein